MSRSVTETTLISIENVKNMVFIQTKPCTQMLMAALCISFKSKKQPIVHNL